MVGRNKTMNIGLCKCGCGGTTIISNRNQKEKGWIKGEYRSYINHHHPAWNKGVHRYCGGKRFEKGQIPWNKGKKGLMKPAWNKGLHWSEEAKQKMRGRRDSLRGKNNPNWKGGTYGTERHRAMGQSEYILWRIAVYLRDNYTCQMCGERGGKLNADHIKPWALYPSLRYAIDNGRTLCVSCHKKTSTYGRGAMYV